MSEPTLRDAINNMPNGSMRTLYEQVLALRLLSIMPKGDSKTPWHLTPDYEAFKRTCRSVADRIESACDDICGQALMYEGKAKP